MGQLPDCELVVTGTKLRVHTRNLQAILNLEGTDLQPSDEKKSESQTVKGQAYGVVGVLDIGCRYLIVVTGRQIVTTLHGKPIYRITNARVIPLSVSDAAEAVAAAGVDTRGNGALGPQTDENEAEDLDHMDTDLEEAASAYHLDSGTRSRKGSASIVEEVFLRKASFSASNIGDSHGIGLDRSLMSSPEGKIDIEGREAKTKSGNVPFRSRLTPKVLRTLVHLLKHSGFYYSDDLDLTSELAAPLGMHAHRSVFAFNKHLLQDLPPNMGLCLVQGFVGETEVRKGVRLVLISRRSTSRPGVRYLRRGIDEQGSTANFVESEQILVDEVARTMHSYVQVRSSMPVFFTQSPYQLQPAPKVTRTLSETIDLFRKHFDRLSEFYHGELLPVSLVEKAPSREGAVGQMYEDLAEACAMPFVWFDFHAACHGMRFENVKLLLELDQVQKAMDVQGWSEYHFEAEAGNLSTHSPRLGQERQQKGALRINCIDCLDRTNVVEMICGRTVLQEQLKSSDNANAELSLAFIQRFNTLWADNGDAISVQYANTNALKGDFTRTQRRRYTGVLTDAFLTLSRFYYGMITDFFTQAVVDLVLGNDSEKILVEFEQRLQNADPALDLRQVRNGAIDIAAGIVLGDMGDQNMLGGWWLSTPEAMGKLRRSPLHDCIVLITSAAIYICTYDLASEKVTDFSRLNGQDVVSVQVGSYFTEILSDVSCDASRNVGFVLHTKTQLMKVTERAAGSSNDRPGLVAFKVPVLQHEELDEILAALKVCCGHAPTEEAEIVSLAQARADTTLWDVLGYKVRRALWS